MGDSTHESRFSWCAAAIVRIAFSEAKSLPTSLSDSEGQADKCSTCEQCLLDAMKAKRFSHTFNWSRRLDLGLLKLDGIWNHNDVITTRKEHWLDIEGCMLEDQKAKIQGFGVYSMLRIDEGLVYIIGSPRREVRNHASSRQLQVDGME